MEKITLKDVKPNFINTSDSELWQKDFIFEKGKKYLIEASTGRGKSTLVSILNGETNDYQGVIMFDNSNIQDLKEEEWINLKRETLARMHQENIFVENASVTKNINLKLSISKGKKKTDINEMLTHLDLIEKKNLEVQLLSEGERQRVNFIRTLAQGYDFIILDEPISMQDVKYATKMADILNKDVTKQGAGLIVLSVGMHPALEYDTIIKL